MEERIYIPIINKLGLIQEVVMFKDNLNLIAPRYINDGGEMGLTRAKNGKLVLMHHYPEFPSCDSAEYISEEEGFEICYNRGKQHLITKLHIEIRMEEGEV